MRSLLIVCLVSSVALAEPKVTSKTTELYPSKSCKEKVKGVDGEDPVLSCPAAMKGYDVTVSFSAETTQVTVTGDGKTTSFSGHLGKTLEWRLVGGKPVTLLVENGDTDPDHTGEVINRRMSIYEVGTDQPKSEAVIDKKTPVAKAWAAARAMADKP